MVNAIMFLNRDFTMTGALLISDFLNYTGKFLWAEIFQWQYCKSKLASLLNK